MTIRILLKCTPWGRDGKGSQGNIIKTQQASNPDFFGIVEMNSDTPYYTKNVRQCKSHNLIGDGYIHVWIVTLTHSFISLSHI